MAYVSLDNLSSGDKARLYAKVREIRAARARATDNRSHDETLREYLRESYLTGCLSRGPECGRKRDTRSDRHYNLTPKGLYGHRYPSGGNLRQRKVRNANGNTVMRPTLTYLKNMVEAVSS